MDNKPKLTKWGYLQVAVVSIAFGLVTIVPLGWTLFKIIETENRPGFTLVVILGVVLMLGVTYIAFRAWQGKQN